MGPPNAPQSFQYSASVSTMSESSCRPYRNLSRYSSVSPLGTSYLLLVFSLMAYAPGRHTKLIRYRGELASPESNGFCPGSSSLLLRAGGNRAPNSSRLIRLSQKVWQLLDW